MALGVPYGVAMDGVTLAQARLIEAGCPWEAAVDLPRDEAESVARGHAEMRARLAGEEG